MPTPLAEIKEGMTDTCTLADIFPGMKKRASVANNGRGSKKKELEAVDLKKKPIFEGYSDSLMEALLDEPKMPLIDWKKKHMRNNELFIIGKKERGNDVIGQELLDLHMRNSIRLLYAQSKPIAPRRVNTLAAQDNAAKSIQLILNMSVR